MKPKVNICTEDWCNLVFDGKNKEYGAYAIRTHSQAQQTKSLFIAISLAGSLAIIPLLKKDKVPGPDPDQSLGSVVVTHVDNDIPKLPPPKTEPPRLPPRSTFKFVDPVIDINAHTDEIPVNDDPANKNKDVGTKDTQGDPNAVNSSLPYNPTEDKDTIHKWVDQRPQFKGGDAEMYRFLKKNLRFPELAAQTGISGRVYVQFVVSKEGEISDVIVTRGLDNNECNEEAMRVIKMMPNWSPGKINGKPVAAYFNIPIVFEFAR
jgi:periplasmic protein TonB